MVAVTVRNIPEEVHRALKSRAQRNGQSTEAEIRAILQEAVSPNDNTGLGSLLENIGRTYGGLDLDIKRDETPAKAASFT